MQTPVAPLSREERRFRFWRRWLLAVGFYVVVFGLALAVFNQTTLFHVLFNQQINPIFWGRAQAPAEAVAFQRFVYGVLGSTMAGWGVLVTYVAWYAFGRRERWARNGLAAAVAVWFFFDTGLSLHTGVPFNAAFNSLFVVLMGLPLAATWRQFPAA